MKYRYKGNTRTKETVSGIVEASNESEARVRLRSMQIRPTFLKPEKANLNFQLKFNFSLGQSVKLKSLIVFTRQLSSLVDSGVSVVQALDLLQQQEVNKYFKKILGEVRTSIESGGTLAGSLERYPSVFNEFFVRVVEAGEVSGTLDKSLKNIGMQLEKLAKLKAKVVKALTYPAMTLLASIGAVAFLLTKVIPEIAKLYGNAKLPELTIMVLNLSQWVQDNVIFILFVVVGVPVMLTAMYKLESFRTVFDPIVLKIPLFGSLAVRSAVARFARTLGTLTESGVPLLTSFEICGKVISNRALKKSIDQASVSVTEGKSIADGLARSGYFPPMVIHMVGIGEMTGRLDELLNKVADIYDDEVDNVVEAITSLLQPLLIVCVGGIILFLMLAMYMPIFNFGDKVNFG